MLKNKLTQYAIGVPLALGIIAFGNAQKAESFEAYGLQGDMLTFAESCDSTMSVYEVGFAKGASNHAGCACMARVVSENIKSPDYDTLSKTYRSYVRSHDDEAARSELVMEMLLSDDDTQMTQFSTLVDAMDNCADRTKEQERRAGFKAADASRAASPSKNADHCQSMPDDRVSEMEALARDNGMRFDRSDCTMVKL